MMKMVRSLTSLQQRLLQQLASKELTLTIPVTAAVDKVNIRINDGIASADPVNDDLSNAFDVNIFLVDADDAGVPTVYSIRRADNLLLPATAATVQVIVTLSEMPKEFKKENLSITDNATISKEPEPLDPVAERAVNSENIASALRDAGAIDSRAPTKRGLYDTAVVMGMGYIMLSHGCMLLLADDQSAAVKALVAAYTAYGAIVVGTSPTGVTVAANRIATA